MNSRAFASALIAAGVLALVPSQASAATVSVQGDTLMYQAAPGERNGFAVIYEPGPSDEAPPPDDPPPPPEEPMLTSYAGAQRVFASQSGFVYHFFAQRSGSVLATPGPGCVLDSSTDEPAVNCSAAGVSRIRFEMGDGNDYVYWHGEERPLPASEVIIGGSGNDVLSGHYRSRRSVISGGPGNDNIGDATVGRGGPGNDEIRGRYGSASTIYGQGGRDALRGGGGTRTGNGPTIWEGRVRIFGGPGNDDVSGGRYADLVNGEAGDDQVTGGQGRDTLVGESGNDTMLSDDRIIPGARRVRDKVGCGAGRDRVFADRLDRLAGCEKVRRQG